jgi:hypothetical protein
MALALIPPRRASAADEINLTVVVKDAETGEPINQAHLTLQFRVVRRFRRDASHAFSAKTDRNGQCRFRHIPVGTVRLIVTAEKHQTFGKEFEIEKSNPVIEVKLRKPQPQV